MNELKNETFETTDFYLTCFLIATGEDLSSAERAGQKVVFSFKSNENLISRKNKYFLNGATVNPLSDLTILVRLLLVFIFIFIHFG